MGLADLLVYLRASHKEAINNFKATKTEAKHDAEKIAAGVFIDVIAMITKGSDYHGTEVSFDGRRLEEEANEDDETEGDEDEDNNNEDEAAKKAKAQRERKAANKASQNTRENIVNDDATYIDRDHLSVNILAQRTLRLIANLVRSRGACLKVIWFGCDMHVNVPVLKQAEWWRRDSAGWSARTKAQPTPAHLWTFSVCEEMLAFVPTADNTLQLGLTLTRADQIPLEMLVDRNLRPVWVSLVFARVFELLRDPNNEDTRFITADPLSLIDEIRLLHPILDFQNSHLFFDEAPKQSPLLENIWQRGLAGQFAFSNRGFHVGEADLQASLLTEHMHARYTTRTVTPLVEVHTNDSDSVCIAMLQALSLMQLSKQGREPTNIHVWLNNERYDIALLSMQVVQILWNRTIAVARTKMNAEELQRTYIGTVIGNVIMWLIICKNDFFPPYVGLAPLRKDEHQAGRSGSIRALERMRDYIAQNDLAEELLVPCASISRADQANRIHPSKINFDVFAIMRLCMVIRTPSMLPENRVQPIAHVRQMFNDVNGFRENDLHALWHAFADKAKADARRRGMGAEATTVIAGITAPPARPLFGPADPRAGKEWLHDMLSFSEFEAFVERLELSNAREPQFAAVYAREQVATSPDAAAYDAIGGVTELQTGQLVLMTFVNSVVVDRRNFRRITNMQGLKRLPFPGDLHPLALFQRACLIAWVITYWFAGHLHLFCARVPLPTLAYMPHVAPQSKKITIDAKASPQCSALYELAGFRLVKSHEKNVISFLSSYPRYNDTTSWVRTHHDQDDFPLRFNQNLQSSLEISFDGAPSGSGEIPPTDTLSTLLANIPLFISPLRSMRDVATERGHADGTQLELLGAFDELLASSFDEVAGILLSEYVDTADKKGLIHNMCATMKSNAPYKNSIQLLFMRESAKLFRALSNMRVVISDPSANPEDDERDEDEEEQQEGQEDRGRIHARAQKYVQADTGVAQENVFTGNLRLKRCKERDECKIAVMTATPLRSFVGHDNGHEVAQFEFPVHRLATLNPQIPTDALYENYCEVTRPGRTDVYANTAPDFFTSDPMRFDVPKDAEAEEEGEEKPSEGEEDKQTIQGRYYPIHGHSYRGHTAGCSVVARNLQLGRAIEDFHSPHLLRVRLQASMIVLSTLSSTLYVNGRMSAREVAMLKRQKWGDNTFVYDGDERSELVVVDLQEQLAQTDDEMEMLLSKMVGILSTNVHVCDYGLPLLAEDANNYIDNSWSSRFALYASIFGPAMEDSFAGLLGWKVHLHRFMNSDEKTKATFDDIKDIKLASIDKKNQIFAGNMRRTMTWPFAVITNDTVSVIEDDDDPLKDIKKMYTINKLLRGKYRKTLEILCRRLPSVRNLYFTLDHPQRLIYLFFYGWNALTAMHYIQNVALVRAENAHPTEIILPSIYPQQTEPIKYSMLFYIVK